MKIVNALPEKITSVLTDSRRITASQISGGYTAFVALKTSLGDGHKYVEDLYRRGLRTFVVDEAAPFAHLDKATFVVAPQGSLAFLIDTAGMRLRASDAKQIVITGSSKKTTAKELITRALKQQGLQGVVRSPRTWNSAMGAALSIFDNLGRRPQVIVTEIGIDAPGQAVRIKPLLPHPEVGVITSITDEHDESFSSHADKVAEKVALVSNAKKIVYCSDDTELKKQLKELHHPCVVKVADLEELVHEVTGTACPDLTVSTMSEVRQVPEDGVLFIDSFTNDLDSLTLSLDLAAQRQAGRHLAVFLGDFDGDREIAKKIVKERGGHVWFFDRMDTDFIKKLHRSDFAHHLILLKGANDALVTYFDEARHHTTLRVDIDALIHNYNTYRSLLPSDTPIIAMVKADAYGLGSLEVAKTLQAHGAAYLAVAVVDEGVALREAGITMPIIVLNPTTNRFEALVKYNLEPTVFSFRSLETIEDALSNIAPTAPLRVHIKLDTGMHRVGFLKDEIPELALRLRDNRLLSAATVFSHLATADCPYLEDYTDSQVTLFSRMSHELNSLLGRELPRHLLNTAGIETLGKTEANFDMARLGIGLYGTSPVPGSSLNLAPAATLTTTIISLRHWPKGTPIGYGCKGCTQRDSVIATLPIGYADGIDRRLGCGNARFAVGPEKILCPTIGNVCMDLLMLDVTDVFLLGFDVKEGTEVEVFGATVPITAHADTLGTIPYQILTSVSPRVRRTYHQR